MGRQEFSEAYAGSIRTKDGNLVIYAVPSKDAHMLQALRRLATSSSGDHSYAVTPASHSFKQLEALTMRIDADHQRLKTAGTELASWGPDVASNTVRIQLREYSRAAADALVHRYGGPTWVTVATDSVRSLPHRANLSRYDDRPPWYAGDNLFFGNQPIGPTCTSAFAYKGIRNGKTYVLTAGHCRGNPAYTTDHTRRYFGPVTNRIYRDGGLDVETLGVVSGGPYTYTGPEPGGGDYTSAIVGVVFLGVGSNVTFNGAYTGQRKKVGVKATDYCQEFSNGNTTCHLDRARKLFTNVCQPGDSGGPVYQFSDTTSTEVYAAGTIVGTSNFNQTCYYQEQYYELEAVNGSIITAY